MHCSLEGNEMAKAKKFKKRPDPLLDEVRKARAELSAQFGHDLGRLCDHLRQIEARHPKRVLQRPRATSR